MPTGCKEEEVEDQTEDGDSFPMGDTYMYMEESSGLENYEAEQQAKAKTRQEKYKAAKISGHLEPLEGNWNMETTDIVNESFDPDILVFRRDGTKLWGAFRMDRWEGVLLVDPAPTKASNAPLPCSWRGREPGEGEIRFDQAHCTGELVFLGGGKIMGCLNLIGDVEFTGTMDAKIQESPRTINDIQKEWKGYNERAHAREELSRWVYAMIGPRLLTMKTTREFLVRMGLVLAYTRCPGDFDLVNHVFSLSALLYDFLTKPD